MSADTPQERWRRSCESVLLSALPHSFHRKLHDQVFADWDASRGPAPAWIPAPEQSAKTNIAAMLSQLKLSSFADLHRWSVEHREEFWQLMLQRLSIRFVRPASVMLTTNPQGQEPRWLPDATLNIVDSCFQAPGDALAIRYRDEAWAERAVTCGELEAMTNRVANGVSALGIRPGDAIAIDMPMTIESVAAYLGILRAGAVVVSVADSFAPQEIAMRLRIGRAKAVVTQDCLLRGGKHLPLYEKVCAAAAPRTIVVPCEGGRSMKLRDGDLAWQAFFGDSDRFESVPRQASDHANVLFSSGTTGEPKAIPWTHLTPIKCATDAFVHQDIHAGDVLAWPTNLGWMMGPWLIFASLINRASMALFNGAPNTRAFGQFVQDAGVTMLGVVPTLVKTWRSTGCMDGLDWSRIGRFSSTGECSNADDMFWLMMRAGCKPVIEYCGGTELGGGYIAGTMTQSAVSAAFSTPAIGIDLVVLDEQGREADEGEVFLAGPSIGFSTELLNANHDEVYYADAPCDGCSRTLRRHGDQMRRLPGGYWQALGRADDTMNLGGIKVSSAEIERVAAGAPGVHEAAAVAVPPKGGGPDRLILYVVPATGVTQDAKQVKSAIQASIADELNPLFRIHDVVCVESLPRTASNKVMRRKLRERYASME